MTEWRRMFFHPRTGESSTSLREIFQQCSVEERQLSEAFYERYLEGQGTGALTPFRGVRQDAGPLAEGARLVRSGGADGRVPRAEETTLEERLRYALTTSLAETEVAVAVSGGVDSWLLAALLQREGFRVTGWYLETGIAGYCEREQVERSSEALGIECRFVRATSEDFIEAAPEFTAVTQAPVYNLHPVSKWLFAEALRREGLTTVVTGDAADQVMRWDWDCDLLPLTMACFRGAGVRMVAPFMAEDVIRFCGRPSHDKQPVRDLARRLGVPAVEKRPTLFPPLRLPSQPRASLPGGGDGVGPDYEDRVGCLSYTTGLLQRWLEQGTSFAESVTEPVDVCGSAGTNNGAQQ